MSIVKKSGFLVIKRTLSLALLKNHSSLVKGIPGTAWFSSVVETKRDSLKMPVS
jgi:hypothetical protein